MLTFHMKILSCFFFFFLICNIKLREYFFFHFTTKHLLFVEYFRTIFCVYGPRFVNLQKQKRYALFDHAYIFLKKWFTDLYTLHLQNRTPNMLHYQFTTKEQLIEQGIHFYSSANNVITVKGFLGILWLQALFAGLRAVSVTLVFVVI